MKIQLKKVLVRILLMLLQVLHRSLCFNFFQINRNTTTNLLADTNQYDCKPDQTVFNPTPCFAGDVKVNLVVDEGETAELRCFVYNVDSSKTLVSWWKERELQEISLGLTTQNKRFYLPRRFYEDWTLIIKKVQPKDAGWYSCQINSESVLEKMFNLKVIAKPEKKAVIDRSYWLVKDEEYNSGNSEGQKPVHKQSEFKFNPHLIRSGPYIANERFQKPLNDERFQRNPIPKTTSEGFCLSYSSTYLPALHAVIVFVHFSIQYQ
ncbi:Immunoglobulin [Echinococcus multilocularis]|uniref:Immunoglobulin n=1 Tax=Echinococcus multilocularis TaxID=6211 RepID=A0A068Y9Y2_ECHMU|nr:Immunoglobulin [Echinococcus multilocularis]